MMQTMRYIGNALFGTSWIISLIKTIPLLGSSGTAVFFPQLDRGLTIALTILGFTIGVVKLIILVRKALQDERFREQEIIYKQKHNAYYDKFNDNFNLTKDK